MREQDSSSQGLLLTALEDSREPGDLHSSQPSLTQPCLQFIDPRVDNQTYCTQGKRDRHSPVGKGVLETDGRRPEFQLDHVWRRGMRCSCDVRPGRTPGDHWRFCYAHVTAPVCKQTRSRTCTRTHPHTHALGQSALCLSCWASAYSFLRPCTVKGLL